MDEPPTRQAHRTDGLDDPGLLGLALVARLHGIAVEPAQLVHQFGGGGTRFGEAELLLAARSVGLKARAVTIDRRRLATTALPVLALTPDGAHFLIAGIDGDRFLIQDPMRAAPEILDADALRERWHGRVLLLASRASVSGEFARFDFTWFIPVVVKYRRLLLEVLGVSLALQLLALITPLLFQVIMDKVLVNQVPSTLTLIGIGLVAVAIFEAALGGLRNYVFAHTTNRIDVELGARLFRHLLALPLNYFTSRRVGDSVARVRELENIRDFLTGQTLTSIIDTAFIVVFLAVMYVYSGWLTLIVVASLPCYALISLGVTPALRARLNEKFARGADNQAFLVESVTGIETVKAMAVEPQFTQRWDRQLAAYVAASFRVLTLATLGQQGVELVSKLVTVAIMWVGTLLVMEGRLTVGQLVAFNMLAGHVSGPIVRLAQLWQEFQQVGISMQRLGDILNARTELPKSRQALASINGAISFDAVTFRYRPDAPEAVRQFSLEVAPGEVIGIVGRSGSGKSTITRLLQRLYVPEQGHVRVDGVDLALADPAWLRRQLGVVLQDDFLFHRSVRENIALSDAAMGLDEVMAAAKLAGAHEFILGLPEGYDTVVGEQGTGLSGGQRQRVAIARALVTNPRILVFDEATSALDYESERAIQDNMREICRGRTVLIVAHRLSAVRRADRILVMEKGQIVESGPHDELADRGGYYTKLLALQAQGGSDAS